MNGERNLKPSLARRWLCLAALWLAGCGGGGPGPYPDASVVLVSVDTLRSDRLPLYGYAKGSTPNIDALAAEGIVFEDVFSHVPLTLPSHASLMTGLLPPRHGVRDNLGFRLGDEPATLAERFRAAGARTGAAISSYVLRSQTGIDRGFEFYDDALIIEGGSDNLGELQRDGAEALAALAGWIDGMAGQRFFAFLHLYEPHSPYTPPEGFRHFTDPYDGEIAYTDVLIGRLVNRLRASGRLEDVILVVTSDHGEGLHDHGEGEHGIFLYREALQVPLILRLPGAALGGRRVAGPLGLVDLSATLLDLAGLAHEGLDGTSVRAALGSDAIPPRRVYAETLYPRNHYGWSELFSAIDASSHFIQAPRPELYDLEADPAETRNLLARQGGTAASLRSWVESVAADAVATGAEDVDAETRERLAALGYVGMAEAAPEDGELEDPKDRIGAFEELKLALKLRRAGKLDEAVAQLRRVLADNPRMIDGWEVLGKTLVGMERYAEALEALRAALRLDPGRTSTHVVLVKAYSLMGKRELARQHAELAALGDPAQGYEAVAQVLLEDERYEEAAAYARQSLAADPQRVMAHFTLGIAAQQGQRFAEAVEHFRAAIDAKAKRRHSILRGLHARLATCLGYLGQEKQAEAEFLRELEIIPHSREARQGLATLYWSQQRDAEARAVLAGLLETTPHPNAETYWAIVNTFDVLGDAPSAHAWRERARRLYPRDERFAAS